MGDFRSLLFLTVLVLISVPVAAQQPPQRDPQAISVLSQTLQASNPGSAALRDSTAAGTITYWDGSSGKIIIKTKGKALRHEIVRSDGPLVYVINGGDGKLTRDGVRSRLPSWATKYQAPEHIPALSRVTDFSLPNLQVIFVGQEEVAGQTTYHILLYALPLDGSSANIEKMISEFHVFVDSKTFLVVKTQGYLFSPDAIENRSILETYYGDYRPVNGVMVAFHMTRRLSGQASCEITLNSVSFNVGVSDSDFQ